MRTKVLNGNTEKVIPAIHTGYVMREEYRARLTFLRGGLCGTFAVSSTKEIKEQVEYTITAMLTGTHLETQLVC